MRAHEKKDIAVFAAAWLGVFLFRFLLLPVRAPNVEPMLATIMPLSKRFGALACFLFAFSGIAFYDALTSGIGMWTLITALCYGSLGMASSLYFRRAKATRANFIAFAVLGTIFYDAVTGLTMGPLLFDQPFAAALAGQIPFTILHLLGSVAFAAFLSPVIYHRLVAQREPAAAPQGAHSYAA